MATAQQKANAVISGIQGTVMGIGSMFGPIGMGVATLTNGVISLMKEVTPFGDWLEDEFKTTKQRINEVNEAINQVNQNDKTKNAQISSLEALVDEYQRLSDKAGAYGINLDNLTKEQQDRYHDITNTFTEYNDAVIAGYDEQGNAIVRGQDALKDTIEVLKQAKLQADKAAMGDKNTFLGNVGLRYQDRGKKEFEQFDQDEADTNLQLQRLSTQGLDNVRAGLDNFVVNQKQIFKNLESLFYSDGVINSAKLEFLNGYNDLIETINTALVGGDTRTLIVQEKIILLKIFIKLCLIILLLLKNSQIYKLNQIKLLRIENSLIKNSLNKLMILVRLMPYSMLYKYMIMILGQLFRIV